MKPNNKSISIKVLASLAFFVFFSVKSLVLGQAMPQVNARFANPQFDIKTKMYFLDVELNSKDSKEYLFGMNLRFFYDASLLEFKTLDQFSNGYGTEGGLPKTVAASGQSGILMFNLKEATVFVNGAIEMKDSQTPLEIVPDRWAKVCRVGFKVPLIIQDKKEFCPSVVWDLKPQGSGGFLAGDDGLVITLLENDPNTPDYSAPAKVNGTFFNWEPNAWDSQPYGQPASKNCIALFKPTLNVDNNANSHTKYEVFQNEPNPFNSRTVIDFVIPSSEEVTFKFFDISGKLLSEISGEYKAGRNAVTVENQPWIEESKVVFYQMETAGFRSEMHKMTIID